ncbi:hypothetical protein LCGC14_0904290 [marine sediment metagenome]|uniref:DUF3987 domain-containing protein n=1 Tax=marine sediment metagenome TaxID=412755 RepID=A0A0F9P047_9ZZZZ
MHEDSCWRIVIRYGIEDLPLFGYQPMPIVGGKAPKKPEKPKKKTERVLDNWLMRYGEYTIESESPEQFHLWTGLSIIASVVRRNVWLDQGTHTLYPNMYVILVGPPGRVRKSTSIRLGRHLLLDIENIHFGADSCTREELIKSMAKISVTATQAAMTIHSTELSSLIEPSGIKMIQFLTDIFDGDFKWRYSTKHQGKDVIHNPVLNILAATTPTWIADGLPADVVGHGFTSRVLFVYGADRRYLKPFPGPLNAELAKDLRLDLDHISRIEGTFKWGKGSKDCYAEIYREIDASTPQDYRVEGFHNRKDIYTLKVAMLLAIARSDELVMYPGDIKTAYAALSAIEESMHKTFSAVGKYDHAADTERLLAAIRESGEMTSEEIHQRFYAAGDVDQIGKMIMMLLSQGVVTRDPSTRKGTPTVYRSVPQSKADPELRGKSPLPQETQQDQG